MGIDGRGGGEKCCGVAGEGNGRHRTPLCWFGEGGGERDARAREVDGRLVAQVCMSNPRAPRVPLTAG